MLQQAAKLCFHPFEALEGEFGAFIVLHMGCSLVELIYKGSAVGGLFSRTRFALFQRLFSSQIRSKIRHALEKKHHLFPSGRSGALTILCHIRKPQLFLSAKSLGIWESSSRKAFSAKSLALSGTHVCPHISAASREMEVQGRVKDIPVKCLPWKHFFSAVKQAC